MHEIENAWVRGKEPKNVLHVELEYPKTNTFDTVEVGVTAVRAVDGVRVRFDFDRDGFVITQPRRWYERSKEAPYELNLHEEWIEAAFCPAWQFELTKSEGDKIVFNEEEK